MKRVVLSCVLVGLLAAGGLARQWSDAAGTSRVEAEYAGMSQGTVVLEKPDGKNVYVPLDKLSQADRQYVESGQAERDRKARGIGAPAEPADEAAPKDDRYARFDKLIEEDPDNPANYVRRGQAKAARGEHAEAIKDFNLAISQDPNFAAAYDGRGSSRAATGDPVGAHKDFSRAVELDPNFAPAYRHRGDNLRALAKTDEGEELFQQVKERFQKKYHYKRKNTLGKHSWQPYNSTTGNVSRGATAMQLAKADYDMARNVEQRYPRGGYGGRGGPGGPGGPGGCGPGGPGSGCGCGCGPNCTGDCCCGPSCPNNASGEAPDSKLKLNPALAVYPEKVEQGQTVTLVANPNELSENMPQKIGPDGKPLPAPKGSKPGDRPKEDIQSVDFYRDVDGDGKFDKDGDQYLATDDDGSDGYTAEVSTKALPPGQQAYFAVPKGGPQPEGQGDSKTQQQIDALRKAAAAERAVAEQSAKAAEGEGYSPVQAKSLKQTQLKDVGSVAIKAAKALKQSAPEAAKLLSDAGEPIDQTTEQLRAGEQSPGEPSKAAAQEAARQATAAAEKIEQAIEKLAEAAAAAADQGDDVVTGQAAAASGEIVPPAPAKAPGPGGPGSGPGGPGPGAPGDRTVAPIAEDRVPEVIDRALGYLDDDDYDRAIPELNRLVVHDPDNDVYLRRRAGAYLASGGYDYAVRDYDRLITRYAGSADLYYNRGCAYLAAGQLERALADFTKSVELNETWNLAYNNRGTTLARMGKYRQAIADFNKAIDIDADDHLAYSNRALAYKKLGETEKAKADFAKARQLRGE